MCPQAHGRLVGGDARADRDQVGPELAATLARVVFADQHSQLGARPLRDLPVLLERPAMTGAELARFHVEEHLAAEHELLVAAEVGDHLAQSRDLGPCQHLSLDGGGAVLELLAAVGRRVNRHGASERGLDRAATADRTPAVIDPALEAQLQSVFDVNLVLERRPP